MKVLMKRNKSLLIVCYIFLLIGYFQNNIALSQINCDELLKYNFENINKLKKDGLVLKLANNVETCKTQYLKLIESAIDSNNFGYINLLSRIFPYLSDSTTNYIITNSVFDKKTKNIGLQLLILINLREKIYKSESFVPSKKILCFAIEAMRDTVTKLNSPDIPNIKEFAYGVLLMYADEMLTSYHSSDLSNEAITKYLFNKYCNDNLKIKWDKNKMKFIK